MHGKLSNSFRDELVLDYLKCILFSHPHYQPTVLLALMSHLHQKLYKELANNRFCKVLKEKYAR